MNFCMQNSNNISKSDLLKKRLEKKEYCEGLKEGIVLEKVYENGVISLKDVVAGIIVYEGKILIARK